jgi:hypothetical protein
MKYFSGALAMCLLAIGAGCDDQTQTAQEVKSAPDVREQLPGFIVRDITGPWKGQTQCYCCRYGLRPVVVIFTRELDDDLKDLVKRIDAKVGENKDKKLAAFVVVLTDDKEAFVPRLKALAKDAGIANTPLTIIEAAAPPEYKIADDADVTVMMWIEKEVMVNRSFVRGDLDKIAIDTLVAETNKILK